MSSQPRPEYPRPQMVREDWINLNGEWEFAEDPGDSGEGAGWVGSFFPERIIVPFCRESELSGLGRHDRALAVWYGCTIHLPPHWSGQRVLLHFGAADYETTVWLDDHEVGRHSGGHTSFTVELTEHAYVERDHRLTVRCRDDWQTPKPRGKQATKVHPDGCLYPRTTGIWQTVWLEPVPQTYLERPRITPSLDRGGFHIVQPIAGQAEDLSLVAEAAFAGETVARALTTVEFDFSGSLFLSIPGEKQILWEPGAPALYHINLSLRREDGTVVDEIKTYSGLRSVQLRGQSFLINGRPVFQRLVLDQGYYPDGMLTAPTDKALIKDIRLAMEAGFNGARLHQKIFEERFLYHADRLGYLVWGEMPDWGHDLPGTQNRESIRDAAWIEEWIEALARDFSHPSIIGWCCLNEQRVFHKRQREPLRKVMRSMYLAAKQADPSRPVLSVSGFSHLLPETDIYDAHNYDQDPEALRDRYASLADGIYRPAESRGAQVEEVPYRGQPFMLSEFGGFKWPQEGEAGWGYGDGPRTPEDFYERFATMCGHLLDNPGLFGYCYTQPTDVFQEQNGIVSFQREEKMDRGRLRQAQRRTAATEEA